MNNQYVCEVCNNIYSNEELLIDHIKKCHVAVYEGKTFDVSEIYQALEKEFPNDKIRIENGSGWYAEFIIHVIHNGMTIEQYLGEEQKIKGNPKLVEEAISQIKWKIETAEKIIRGIGELGQFKELYCKNFDYGYSSDEHSFIFIFTLLNEEEERVESYYPWGNNQTVEEFISGFKQYFVDKLEGEWTTSYVDGYFSGYLIDGTPVDGLVSRAKKVRLEIIE